MAGNARTPVISSNSGDVGMSFAHPVENSNDSAILYDTFANMASINVLPNLGIELDHVEQNFVNECAVGSQHQSLLENIDQKSIDRMNPYLIAHERINTWPDIDQNLGYITDIYNSVRATGLPNSLGAKIPLYSAVKVDQWRAFADSHYIEEWLLEMLRYGFPLQYTGGPPKDNNISNHISATQYPNDVRKYIQKEIAEGALAGPFDSHPFPTARYVNPIMSRPKTNSPDRRIIVDLAFPEGKGINAHVIKNCVFGISLKHELPTIQQAVHLAKTLNLNVAIAVIDIERAYRNYRSDPIDWPLLVMSFDEKYYIDLGLPFGARLSSLYVQRIANFIVGILNAKGIHCAMYLDDLFLLCDNNTDVHLQFSQAMAVIRAMGLPINYKKLIAPTTHAVWLGVTFDIQQCVISIPHSKVQQLIDTISNIQRCKYISYKQTQSIVGRIAHIARVVPAARVFMCRILDQLRASDGKRVYINYAILADLKWFRKYFAAHNATSIIDASPPAITIEADSSLVAGGAWADGRYYIYTYPQGVVKTHNICQLEALNYLISIRAFVNCSHKGRTIEIIGDNAGAISALSSGRATDPVLAAVARALWFHSAKFRTVLKFTHRNGNLIAGADALSRAPLSETERGRADDFIRNKSLRPVKTHNAYINYSNYL